MIGIRAEDKNRWERRAPLTPAHVGRLVEATGAEFRVQSSALRTYSDDSYRDAGARIVEHLGDCPLVLGVKEIPPDRIEPGRTYLLFSHVTKGQAGNMPLLRRFLEAGCTLIDYEQIVDAEGRRIIFFGRFAGYAGMIDTLWALGRRLEAEGHHTPFAMVRRAHEYGTLDDARRHLMTVGQELAQTGLPEPARPLVFGFTGSGQVFEGAREILHLLRVHEVAPRDLERLFPFRAGDPILVETDFHRHHRYERIDGGGFDGAEFLAHAERYRSAMGRWLPYLSVLVHGAYWEPPQPRLVTIADLEALWSRREQPRLRVLGDISCDIDGAIEATVRPTDPGDPVFVYEIEGGGTPPGVEGRGPVVLAVDNLPCELPREASQAFSDHLLPFVPDLIGCDWERPFDRLSLPSQIRHAIIAHRGRLTPRFAYLERCLAPA